MTGLADRLPVLKPLRTVVIWLKGFRPRPKVQVHLPDMRWTLDFARWPWYVRWFRLNRLPNVAVSRTAFVSPTAILQLRPEGIPFGGSITIEQFARIADGAILAPYGGSIRVAENASIGPYTLIYGQGGVTVGRDTMIAGHVYIVSGSHTFDDLETPILYQPNRNVGVSIGNNVWLGGGVRVLDGVTIGDGCVVGAGAVVTRSIEPNSIARGVPARVVGVRGHKADRVPPIGEES